MHQMSQQGQHPPNAYHHQQHHLHQQQQHMQQQQQHQMNAMHQQQQQPNNYQQQWNQQQQQLYEQPTADPYANYAHYNQYYGQKPTYPTQQAPPRLPVAQQQPPPQQRLPPQQQPNQQRPAAYNAQFDQYSQQYGYGTQYGARPGQMAPQQAPAPQQPQQAPQPQPVPPQQQQNSSNKMMPAYNGGQAPANRRQSPYPNTQQAIQQHKRAAHQHQQQQQMPPMPQIPPMAPTGMTQNQYGAQQQSALAYSQQQYQMKSQQQMNPNAPQMNGQMNPNGAQMSQNGVQQQRMGQMMPTKPPGYPPQPQHAPNGLTRQLSSASSSAPSGPNYANPNGNYGMNGQPQSQMNQMGQMNGQPQMNGQQMNGPSPGGMVQKCMSPLPPPPAASTPNPSSQHEQSYLHQSRDSITPGLGVAAQPPKPPQNNDVIYMGQQPAPVPPVPQRHNSMVPDPTPRLTLPLRDSLVLEPTKLDPNLHTSHLHFTVKPPIYQSLLQRDDLDLHFKAFAINDLSMSTNWPPGLTISLNQSAIQPDERSQRPCSIKALMQPGVNTLQITVSQCLYSHQFMIHVVNRPAIGAVVADLVKRKSVPREVCLSNIRAQLSGSNHDGVVATAMNVPLKCALSQARVRVPARGADCKHVACFDLESYLSVNSGERASWTCPVCSKAARIDALLIDTFVWSMVREVRPDVDEVCIDSQGAYKPVSKRIVDLNPVSPCEIAPPRPKSTTNGVNGVNGVNGGLSQPIKSPYQAPVPWANAVPSPYSHPSPFSPQMNTSMMNGGGPGSVPPQQHYDNSAALNNSNLEPMSFASPVSNPGTPHQAPQPHNNQMVSNDYLSQGQNECDGVGRVNAANAMSSLPTPSASSCSSSSSSSGYMPHTPVANGVSSMPNTPSVGGAAGGQSGQQMPPTPQSHPQSQPGTPSTPGSGSNQVASGAANTTLVPQSTLNASHNTEPFQGCDGDKASELAENLLKDIDPNGNLNDLSDLQLDPNDYIPSDNVSF